MLDHIKLCTMLFQAGVHTTADACQGLLRRLSFAVRLPDAFQNGAIDPSMTVATIYDRQRLLPALKSMDGICDPHRVVSVFAESHLFISALNSIGVARPARCVTL